MWTQAERDRAARAAREHARAELQKKLSNAKWYLEQSANCTELTKQRWRDLIADIERDLTAL